MSVQWEAVCPHGHVVTWVKDHHQAASIPDCKPHLLEDEVIRVMAALNGPSDDIPYPECLRGIAQAVIRTVKEAA